MLTLRITDLAEAMIEELAPQRGYKPESIKVKVTGRRTAEKNHEELLTEDEAINARETEDMFIISQIRETQEQKTMPIKRYTSDNVALLSKEEIKEMLRESLPQVL